MSQASRPAIPERDPYIDLSHPTFIQDPYPHYDRVRAHARVYYSETQSFWFVSGYDEVLAALRDRRLGAVGNTVSRAVQAEAATPRFASLYHRWLITRDDATHTRLRLLMTKAFTPKAVNNFTPRIVEIVDELLSDPLSAGRMDFIADLAYHLPLTVISELLGIPKEDRKQAHEWVESAVPLFDPSTTPEKMQVAEQAVADFETYLTALVEKRRAHPEGKILDALIAAEEAGDQLTNDEIVANAMLLFAAGFETTTNALGNGLYALLSHPDQLELLLREPARAENAVEELLRYETSAQLVRRGAYEDLELMGQSIPRGAFVIASVGAGNRDPKRYENPAKLDISRNDIRPLSFGAGMHTCLGAHLARVEMRIALERLFSRVSSISLERKPSYRPLVNMRGLTALPVNFRTR